MADSNKPNSSRNHDDKVWKAMGLVTAFGIEIALLSLLPDITLAHGWTRPLEATEYGSP